MAQLISKNLTEALLSQVGHEMYNSNFYLFISGFLKNKGLNKLGDFFLGQHKEELKHSLMIFDILTDLNANPIIIPEIDEINIPFETIVDIASRYLEREILTTESLDEIKKIAIDENCPVVEEAMRDMIKLQRCEYAEATDFVDKANLTSGDWWKVMLWDLSLKE